MFLQFFMHLYILMLSFTDIQKLGQIYWFSFGVFPIAFRFWKSFITPKTNKIFTYISSSFWKLYMAVAYCFLKDREEYHRSRSAFVPSPFLLPILIHRCPFGFWWFYFSHFSFSHQLEFILLCGLKWKSNLRIFFPDSEPIFPTPLFNNSSLPPWFVKAHIFWVTKTGNSQWHYATKITCLQGLESTRG